MHLNAGHGEVWDLEFDRDGALLNDAIGASHKLKVVHIGVGWADKQTFHVSVSPLSVIDGSPKCARMRYSFVPKN